MRFSLANVFLLIGLSAALLTAIGLYGHQGIVVAILPTVFLITLSFLVGRKYLTHVVAVTTIYAGLWIATALFGVNSLIAEVADHCSRHQVPDVLQVVDHRLLDKEIPLASAVILDTPGPWHYFEIVAVPCPLLIIADRGEVNAAQSGPGGRLVIFWYGAGNATLSWRPYWYMN